MRRRFPFLAGAAMTTNGYAVVQLGYAVFGVGGTQVEAWSDASQFMSEPMDDDSTEERGVHGELYCMPATAALIAAVQARGGDVSHDVVDGVVMTAAEAEAL